LTALFWPEFSHRFEDDDEHEDELGFVHFREGRPPCRPILLLVIRTRRATSVCNTTRDNVVETALRLPMNLSLVSCPRNKHAFRPAVAGSVGCFSRRERRAYLNRYVRCESRGCGTEKQPTGRGPEGCDENGPAAALLVGYVSI
jgi:hypothetical protein